MSQFKYLEVTVTNKNPIQEESKRDWILKCLQPFGPEPSVFTVAVDKLKNEENKTIILPVLMYGCETWSLILREEHRPRIFENKGRRIFNWKGIHWREDGENCPVRSLVICNPRLVLLE
jgi:hypothetical protein